MQTRRSPFCGRVDVRRTPSASGTETMIEQDAKKRLRPLFQFINKVPVKLLRQFDNGKMKV